MPERVTLGEVVVEMGLLVVMVTVVVVPSAGLEMTALVVAVDFLPDATLYPIRLHLLAVDRYHMLSEIIDCITHQLKLPIEGLHTQTVDNIVSYDIDFPVHSYDELQTAISVGKRHGNPIVYQVDSYRMSTDGHKFYLSENGVWLTDHVPAKYLHRIL